MPRPPKHRRVELLPQVSLFKPAGVPMRELERVTLNVEELEALRLKDLEGLGQEACAERMRISRPTFQRVLREARRKVAQALVEGAAIAIEGGNYQLAQRRLECTACGHHFQRPFGSGRARDLNCPACGKRAVRRVGSTL